jgi:hypothetical protein
MHMDEQPLGKKDKISVLLAEYSTLRAEAQQRLTLLVQCTAIAITVLVALMGVAITQPQFPSLYYLFGVSLALYLGVVGLIHKNVYDVSTRLCELDEEINDLAGERLLKWETDQGYARLFRGWRKPKTSG